MVDSVGAVYVRVLADTSGLKKQIERAAKGIAEKEGAKAGQEWGKGFEDGINDRLRKGGLERAFKKNLGNISRNLVTKFGKDLDLKGWVAIELDPEIGRTLEDLADQFDEPFENIMRRFEKEFPDAFHRAIDKVERDSRRAAENFSKDWDQAHKLNIIFDKKVLADLEKQMDFAKRLNVEFDNASMAKAKAQIASLRKEIESLSAAMAASNKREDNDFARRGEAFLREQESINQIRLKNNAEIEAIQAGTIARLGALERAERDKSHRHSMSTFDQVEAELKKLISIRDASAAKETQRLIDDRDAAAAKSLEKTLLGLNKNVNSLGDSFKRFVGYRPQINGMFNDIKKGANDSSGMLDGLSKRMRLIVIGILALGSQIAQVLTGIAGAVSAIISLVGRAAGSLLGLIPVIASVGAGVATMVIGFGGVGKAFSTISSEMQKATEEGRNFNINSKEVQASLKGLTSEAKEFVIGITSIRKEWQGVRSAVQSALFKNLGKQISPISGKVMPQLKRGFVALADVLNTVVLRALKEFGDFDIEGLFTNLAPILRSVSNAIVTFGLSLLKLTGALAPSGEKIGQAFEKIADKFSAWIDQASESGKLQKMMDSFLTAASQVGAILGAGAQLLGNFFMAGQAGQEQFANGLVGLFNKWNDWVVSVEGSQAIQKFYDNAYKILQNLKPLWEGLKEGFHSIVTDDAINRLDGFATSLGAIFAGIGQAIGLIEASGVFQALAQVVALFVSAMQSAMPALTQLATVINVTLGGVLEALAPAIHAFGDAFGAALSAALPALSTLGQTLVTVFQQISGPLSTVITSVVGAIGTIAPPLISIFGTIATAIGTVFTAAAPLITEFVNILSSAFTALAPIITDTLTAITPVLTGIVTTVGPILGEMLQTLSGVFLQIAPMINGIIVAIQPVLTAIVQSMSSIFSAIAPLIGEIIGAIAPLLTSLAPVISSLVGAIVPVISSIVQAFTPLIPVIIQVVQLIAGELVRVFQMLAPMIIKLVVALMPLIEALLEMAMAVLPPLIDAIMPVIDVIVNLATTIATALVPIVNALSPLLVTLAPIIVQLVVAFTPLLNIIVSLAPIIGVLAQLLATLLPPIIGVVNWIVQLIAPIISLVIQFLSFNKALDDVGKMFGFLASIIGGWISSTVGFLKAAVTGIVDFWKAGWALFESIIAAVLQRVIQGFRMWWGVVSGIFNVAKSFIQAVWNAISAGASAVIGVISGAWNGLTSILKAPFNALKTAVQTIFSWIGGKIDWLKGKFDAIKGFLGKIPGIGGLFGGNDGNAAGGIIYGPTRTLVGEAGPEAIIPLTRPLNMVNPEVREMARMLRSPGSQVPSKPSDAPSKVINLTQNIHPPQIDPVSVARSVLNDAVLATRM